MLNRKFKILIVHNFYQQPGGEDTVFRNEKRLLEDNGHKVIIYTRDNSELKGNILKKIFLPFITIFNPKTYFDIKKIIKEKNIDIVHVHNTLCLISPAVFYAALKMKTPVVQTLHNFRMQCVNGLFYRDNHICEDCLNKGFVSALKHKCYRNSFLQTLALIISYKFHQMTGIYKKVNFICLTSFNKDKLLLINKNKKNVDVNKVYVKSNFVFDINDSKIHINAKSNVDYDKKYLYVGRLDDIKGIDVVLEAFSNLKDCELNVIGSGGNEYISKYNNFKNINFLGQLPHEETLMEMKKSSALIYPTKLYEGQPVTIIEAYMNGLPVITSNIGNANEMVKDEITGLHFVSGDVNSLIGVMNKFKGLNKEELKMNTRSEYDNYYSYDKGYKNIYDIYNHILKNIGGL